MDGYNKYLEYDIIDFLENQEFRNFIINKDSDFNWNELQVFLESKNKDQNFLIAKKLLKNIFDFFEGIGLSEDELNSKIEKEIQDLKIGYQKQIPKSKFYFIRIAAVFVFLFASILGIWLFTSQDEVYHSPPGLVTTFTLDDQSTLTLNGNSKAIWKSSWKRIGKRQLFLEGEGFFEVEKVKDFPFEVITDDLTVKVLGTKFNVNSRQEGTTVILESGSIEVHENNNPDHPIIMKPGDRVDYSIQNRDLDAATVEDLDSDLAWKEGILVFKDQSLESVLNTIDDIYNKSFEVKDSSVLSRKITATIPIADWKISSKAIELSMKVSFENVNDSLIIIK